jgi:DNA invertase Pin-like site-specific DNA recombinase
VTDRATYVKPQIDPVAARQLRDNERLGPSAIARRLGIGRANVYRVLGEATGWGSVGVATCCTTDHFIWLSVG